MQVRRSKLLSLWRKKRGDRGVARQINDTRFAMALSMGLHSGMAPKAFDAANYDITFEDGTLTIDPRNVTLTSASGAKFFDGTPIQMNNPAVHITIGGDGFAAGEGATYNITGSQTNVGQSANAFTERGPRRR